MPVSVQISRCLINLELHLCSLDYLHWKQRASVYQTTQNGTGTESSGNSRSDLTKEPFLLISLSANTDAREYHPIVCGSDIASHPLLLLQSHHKVQRSFQKDSNLVDSASSIRLSQRLSHACLSINKSIRETANGSLYQLQFI